MISHTALDDETNHGCWKSMDILTIRIALDSLRAIEMWSRWLYGLPMWSEYDCHNVDDDLECLVNIFYLCTGDDEGKGRDYDGLNACVDAIRDLVLNEAHVPTCPISVLVNEDYESDILIKMLAELLVHGKCVRDGRTKRWLEQNADQRPSLLKAVINEFAKKAMGEASPDTMARCAYHTHLPGSECDLGPRGRAWNGKSDQPRALEHIVLTDHQLL